MSENTIGNKKYTEILELVQSLEENYIKFYDKGNQAAAVRARGKLQEIKKLSQIHRLDIQEKKKIK